MSTRKKIESLTPGQERALIEYRDAWLVHGQSTEPSDRANAETAIRAMYAALGKPAPHVWWCDGPAVGSLARTFIRSDQMANLWDTLWATLGANLRATLGANLGANLGATLGATLRATLRDTLGANLGANLGATLRATLRATLGATLGANLRANLGANLDWGFWGQHEAYWPAYFAWPHDALRAMHTAEQVERLEWWLQLARSTGWWHPFEKVVFMCERPARQAVDDRGRLHHPTQAALLCRDGWTVHAWHGTRVPADWIEHPDAVEPQVALTHPNVEQRRALCEILGWGRVLQQLTHRTIDTDADPQIGALIEVELPDAPKSRFLKVRCATGRDFVLPVPVEMKTALQANAWTYSLPADEYRPERRT